MQIFILAFIALILISAPLFNTYRRIKANKPVNKKFTLRFNMIAFFGIMIMATILPLGGFVGAEGAEAAAAAAGSDGLKYLAAALSTGLATIGTGIAVAGAAPAAIGAVSEDEKSFTKALIFVALGEGVAIYGLLISILILFS